MPPACARWPVVTVAKHARPSLQRLHTIPPVSGIALADGYPSSPLPPIRPRHSVAGGKHGLAYVLTVDPTAYQWSPVAIGAVLDAMHGAAGEDAG